jgi:hypothetical protein
MAISIVIALVLLGLVAAYMINQRNQYQTTPTADNKKLPGDDMTQKAVDNASSGKTPMDGIPLPADNKPKANDIQGGSGEMRGDVINEGNANNIK